jgi:hypothetical protein
MEYEKHGSFQSPQYEELNNSNKSSMAKEIVMKKRGNFILRQELKSFTPGCGPRTSIFCNLLVVLVFCLVGFPIIMLKKNIKEYKISYDW